jgi:hypothetical protein
MDPSSMRHAFALSAILLLACLCIHSNPAHASGQCTTQETTYFSCDTAKHKTISLCGATPSALQYRYGKPTQAELKFPDNPSDGVNQLRYAHYSRFQTDRSEVTFSHGGVDYALFDYTEQGKRTAGVHITLADGSEHEVQCAGPIEGHLNALAKSLRCDADNALNGGVCP